jgi:hypothetical protein
MTTQERAGEEQKEEEEKKEREPTHICPGIFL